MPSERLASAATRIFRSAPAPAARSNAGFRRHEVTFKQSPTAALSKKQPDGQISLHSASLHDE